MHPHVHCSTVYSGQHVGATSATIHRGMGEEDVMRVYTRMLRSHQNEWDNAICSNMDGPRDGRTN